MRTLLASILLGLLLAPSPAYAQLGLINEGKPFPDIVLPSLDDGAPMSIADYRGKRVMLIVFASW
jgi:hypothetical protein